MLKTTLAGLRAHRLRLLLTAMAITLGVGFISGTFVLTDSMDRGVGKTFARSAGKVTVAILPEDGGIPASVLDEVRALPGVVEAQPKVEGEAALLGKDGKAVGEMPTLGVSVPSGRLLRYDVDEGRVPSGAAEAVLDAKVAEREGFEVGDTITVLDRRARPHRFTLVGIVDFGIDQEIGYRGAVGFDVPTATLMTGERTYREIDLAGGDKAAVAAAVGDRYEVRTGQELAAKLAREAGADTKVIRAGLLLFALVAMLVSALVIYNTFAILIAQRMREMALLRCVGATRRQVFAGVLADSAAVGLAGSLLGLAAGLGLGAAALAVVGRFADMPVEGLTLTGRAVAIGLGVGIAVTLASAVLPARSATRIAPVAALRTELEPGTGRFRLGRLRTLFASVLVLTGLGFGVLGSVVMEKGQAAMYLVAVSGGVFFLGVMAAMPALIRPFGRVAGAVPARFGGVPGRLAVANAQRAPRRTATTTIALTVGVGLMSLFAVVAASGKATAAAKVDEQFPVDFQIRAQLTDEPARLPRALAASLRARPELAAVIEVRDARHGSGRTVTAVTMSALGTIIKPAMAEGSLSDLRPGTAMVDQGTAKDEGLRLGDTVEIATARGTVPVRLAAVYGEGMPFTGLMVPETDFDRYFTVRDPSTIFVKAREGIPGATARKAVETAADPYPIARISSAIELKESLGNAIDMILMIFAGLLGLAIVIALFGIANTLTLSVVERTRESALLRALGLTRRQLRRMLSIEAMVMAVIGAGTGVVLGIGFGWAATNAMANDSVFAVPYLQVITYVALAAAAGTLAAVLPARRAAKTSIVESLTHD
ncbi:ABC transporter permease [Spirillospora albida]|uniref:ABC transporter permease n=1 Tax=Spirillospora albida TaxID=58123 RepID=UPI0004C0C2E7|nr:FtsX-like permease family protein [Spirillospora albida]